jgi:hypothetical protein
MNRTFKSLLYYYLDHSEIHRVYFVAETWGDTPRGRAARAAYEIRTLEGWL